jgi:hypothetical protein
VRMLANPIRLDGQRLPGRGCSPLGADTERLLGRAQTQSGG